MSISTEKLQAYYSAMTLLGIKNNLAHERECKQPNPIKISILEMLHEKKRLEIEAPLTPITK